MKERFVMKIVSWNCNGAFRKKYETLDKIYDADIYVIQECENPELSKDEGYIKFGKNGLWQGYKNKGLGIFAKDNITLEPAKWSTYGLQYFIPCKVNNKFNLLGVWACGKYIEEFYVFLQIYKEKYEDFSNTVIRGDFNSNSIWDKQHKNRNHSAVVEDLSKGGLHSCYHLLKGEKQGEESTATFYMHRYKEKGFFIDYFFCNKDKKYDFSLGLYEDWIGESDHMPMMLEIDY